MDIAVALNLDTLENSPNSFTYSISELKKSQGKEKLVFVFGAEQESNKATF